MVEEEIIKLRDAACILIGADMVFNKGLLTNTLLITYSDFLKNVNTKNNADYVSQEDLIDAAFGC